MERSDAVEVFLSSISSIPIPSLPLSSTVGIGKAGFMPRGNNKKLVSPSTRRAKLRVLDGNPNELFRVCWYLDSDHAVHHSSPNGKERWTIRSFLH